MTKKTVLKIVLVILANMLIGISIGLFRMSEFGTDPFSCMNLGISSALHMQFGTLQLIVNCIIFILMIFTMRKLIGFGTVCNMVGVGFVADYTVGIMEKISSEYNMTARIILLVIATVLICFGVAFYMSADMGTAPYDSVGLIIEKYTNGKLQFKYARIISDAVCVIIGLICGFALGIQWQIAGIGTIIMTFFTGPLVQFFRERIAIPIFKRISE